MLDEAPRADHLYLFSGKICVAMAFAGALGPCSMSTRCRINIKQTCAFYTFLVIMCYVVRPVLQDLPECHKEVLMTTKKTQSIEKCHLMRATVPTPRVEP